MIDSAPTNFAVIVLGDQGTGQSTDVLVAKAAEHGAVITEIHTFDLGQVVSHHDLTEIDVVVTALSRAIATNTSIWVPFPMEDLRREQHIRRISLVLQRHGINLLLGQHLRPCPVDGGMNEVDVALRQEVRAVDELNCAALASAGFTTLDQEIELALATTPLPPTAPSPQISEPPNALEQLEVDFGPGPALPPPMAPWSQRYPALKRFASWLVHECGLNQASAAEVINAAGHRTPQGRAWQQPTISALINGRYDRGAAA